MMCGEQLREQGISNGCRINNLHIADIFGSVDPDTQISQSGNLYDCIWWSAGDGWCDWIQHLHFCDINTYYET